MAFASGCGPRQVVASSPAGAPRAAPDSPPKALTRHPAPFSPARSVMERGRRAAGPHVVLFAGQGLGSLAVISSRKVGNAVARNRARRIMRAAWQQLDQESLEPHDIVLLARAAIAGASSTTLVPELRGLARKAGIEKR